MVKKPSKHRNVSPATTGDGKGDQLAERVVHELNNLIDGCMRNMALAVAQLRHTSDSDDAEAQDAIALERLETATLAMREMAALTRQWSKLAAVAEKDRPSLTSVASVDRLPVVVAQTVRLLSPAAASAGITLDANVAADLADLPAGPMFPVLLNAVRNSIDAIAASQSGSRLIDGAGQVFISARRDAGDLVLTVTDNGPGIAPNLLDDDGQFRFGRTTKAHGHGLGLSLCREMLGDYGGTITPGNRTEGGAQLVCRCPIDRLRARA